MNKPTCCGKICQPVKKTYGKYGYFWISKDGLKWALGSIVLFFRCRVCGHLGVPFSTATDSTYMDSLDAIREEGIKFDATLSNP